MTYSGYFMNALSYILTVVFPHYILSLFLIDLPSYLQVINVNHLLGDLPYVFQASFLFAFIFNFLKF